MSEYELADPYFFVTCDGSVYEDLPDDAIEIRHRIGGYRSWVSWPKTMSDYVAVAQELVRDDPALLERLPWPMEMVGESDRYGYLIYKRAQE